jgi:hypothetical protein
MTADDKVIRTNGESEQVLPELKEPKLNNISTELEVVDNQISNSEKTTTL